MKEKMRQHYYNVIKLEINGKSTNGKAFSPWKDVF